MIPTGPNKFDIYEISEHQGIKEWTNPKTNQLFANLNVINTKTNDKTIDQILSVSGANVIDSDKKYNFTSRTEMFIILVDSYDYNQKEVLSIYNKFNINSNIVHIVTIEWLVACLEYGYIVDFINKPINPLYNINLFAPPTNIAAAPYCIKVQLDTVERYSKYDIIKYFTADNTVQIGQIIDIQCQNTSLNCHILPLSINDKKIINFLNNLKEIIIIQPEKILQRVSIYTIDTYNTYKYSLVDENIFCI